MADEIQTQQQVNGTTTDTDFFSSMFGDEPDDGFRSSFNDSGELEINFKQAAPSQDAETLTETVGDVASSSQDRGLEDSTPAPTDATQLTGRVAQLESQLAQVIGLLQQQLQGNNNIVGQQNNNQQQQLEEEVDLTDPQHLRRYIKQLVGEEVNPSLTSLKQTQAKTELYMQYSDAVTRHGQPFIEQLPAIKEVMTANPGLSFDNAYNLIKTVLSVQKTPTVPDGGSQKQLPTAPRVQPAQQARTLVQKAQQLKTQTGVGIQSQSKPVKYANMEEAADAAFDALFG